MAEWLLRSDRGPTSREGIFFGAALALLGIAAYLGHVLDGGFYSDDWANAAGYHFADPPRYWSSVAELERDLGGRPLLALLLPIPHALFGVDPSLHLALALALGVVTSLSLYVVLRTLAMAPLHAAAIATLALLFPWSDSIRLWSTASINTISVCFFLIGLVIALRGLSHRGRSAIAMHGAADLLYLLSILTYEVTAAAALLCGLLYRGRASSSAVARRWLADVCVVLVGVVYSLATTVSSRHVGSVAERLEDVGPFAKDSLLLLASSIEPFGSPGRAIQALLLLATVIVVVAALLRLRRGGDRAIADWLRWIAIGAVAVAAAYFMFLGSHLHPRDPGIDNRINVFAGLAFCLLAYALVAGACTLLFRSRLAAATATVSVALVIAVGYEVKLAQDQSDWRAAAARQGEMLDAIEARLPPLPHHSAVLGFGYPAQVAPEVPVFDHNWDLSGALRLRADDASIRAFPIFAGVDVRCGGELLIDGGAGYGSFESPYRRLYFVDPAGSTVVRSRSECEQGLRRFHPGPLES